MQVQDDAPTRAAIDIGSNTLQLVIARCQANDLTMLVDEEDIVRLGEDVNARGRISAAKRDEVLSILKRYKALAAEHHRSRAEGAQ
jgi:exopolyphosphatase/pppGpp-phosphohydrolase